MPGLRMLLTASLLSLAAAACGQAKDKDTSQSTRPPEVPAPDAAPRTVALDGRDVPFAPLGEPVAYEGRLTKQDDVYTYSTGRAFELAAPTTLFLREAEGTSTDCGTTDFGGPAYMVLKIVPGGEPEIVRSTEGIHAGGAEIPASSLATFPGELEAGTYVLTVDYLSLARDCLVAGRFTLAE